jgi:hypothetical protein
MVMINPTHTYVACTNAYTNRRMQANKILAEFRAYPGRLKARLFFQQPLSHFTHIHTYTIVHTHANAHTHLYTHRAQDIDPTLATL